jgi:hypothetical protein
MTASVPRPGVATDRLERIFESVVKSAILALFAVGSFPRLLTPEAWGRGVEWSWQMALHESVARGLVYGRDFVFTYGPLGFVAYPLESSRLLGDAVVWRLIIHAVLCLALGINLWQCRSLGLAALLGIAFTISQIPDDFPMRILLAEVAFLTYGCARQRDWAVVPAAALAAVALLTKFNVGAVGLFSLAIWFALRLADVRWTRVAAWSLAGAIVFLACFLGGFWHYGGPLSAVPEFLAGGMRLAAGYSAQMATQGPWFDQVAAISCLSLIAAGAIAGSFVDRHYAAVGLVLSGALFGLFKNGFVREDMPHVFLFFAALPAFTALFLVLPETRVQRRCASVVCLLVTGVSVFVLIGGLNMRTDLPIAAYLPDGPHNLADGLNWTSSRKRVRVFSQQAFSSLRLPARILAAIGTASVDSYPKETTVVFANGLSWSPRPVPQSYSVYLPELDELNARHYRSPYGPELILYELDAIDDQHPWFVDPLTLRELYCRYDVVSRLPRFLVLKRRPEPRPWDAEPTSTFTVRPDERVTVPHDGQHLLAAALKFRLTAAGQLKDKLWKVYPPSLRLEFADGSTRKHRLVWRNAVNGLLISELPTTLQDFDALWEPGRRTRVEAFTVLADPGDFAGEVELTWIRTPIPAKPVS